MATTKEVLSLAVEIADVMLRNGGEIYRIEDTVIHILKAYEVENFDVYVLSNGIFASANEDKEDACSMIRHVPLGSVNLSKIAYLNQLTRDLCTHKCTIVEAWERVKEAKNLPNYSNKIQNFFCGLGSACYTFIFGGGIIDFGFSFLIGLLEQMVLNYMSAHKISRFLRNVFASAFVSTCSILVLQTGLPVLQDKIIIGAIMPLVPGITFTTSIRDFHNGDYLSGTIHLIDALLTALCIAVGIIIPMAVFNSIGGGALLP
ncbi:MAG: threonine/serine exporter family protein [Agathobacter sp.]|nr:threonine/serine exporter family protein [Agathobacter sp.]